jgi:hypothetical protein
VPLIGPAHDPETLVTICRALDAAFRQAIPNPKTLNNAEHRRIREKLASALLRAYDDGERDSEVLTNIAVQSCCQR